MHSPPVPLRTVAIALCAGALLATSVAPVPASAQTKEEVRQQAESRLSKMTPAEIDRKIKELGMTREEATKKAAEMGISLEQYLGAGAATTQPGAPAQMSTDTLPAPPPNPPPSAPPPKSSTGLSYFGYDIFSTTPAAFEPTAVGPVDPDYVIGPGDVLRVTVWGQVEFQNELTVDKEGRIFISTVGQELVAGLTVEQAYKKLLKDMSRSYSGLVARNPTVWLDLTLAKLRPKRIYIMGEVGKPGGYTVSSYSTVFNSLYAVGGPTIKGSLRDIRVIRDQKVIADVDLYDYLTGASTTNDIRVQNNDIIFVPERGKTVAIRGAVNRPAIYELKDDENLTSLLRFCGGLLPTAYTPSAQVDRVKPFAQRTGGIDDRIVVDVDLKPLLEKQQQDFTLYDDDEVQVFSILDFKNNYATITGSVWRPGRYELGAVRTLRDLIAAAKGLEPKAYLGLAHLIRLNEDLITTRIIPFDLKLVMSDESYNRRLMPRDEVIIYSTEMTEIKDRFVTIRGEVKSPGTFPLRDNMTLVDLVATAGGYTEAAERLEAEVSRIMPRGVQGDSLVILLHPNLPTDFTPVEPATGSDTVAPSLRAESGRFLLMNHDEVLVRPNPNFKLQEDVTVTGDFKYPGVYAIEHRGERLSEILRRAGGPTTTSYLGGAQLYRKRIRLLVDFNRAYRDHDDEYDVMMMGGDSIAIPSRPYTVLVTGEVNKPGLLSFLRGESVSDYIDRAGGRTDSADYAVLTQPTGESRRVNFGFLRNDPGVPEGSSIHVLKVPAPPPEEKGESFANTMKDLFAIATSAATLAFIVWQVSK